MLRAAYDEIIELTRKCQLEINRLQIDFGKKKHPGEESLTKAIAMTLNKVLQWKSKKLSIETQIFDTCKYTEEKPLGADILLIYTFNSPELQASNGALIQAKVLKHGYAMPGSADMGKFRGQCLKMLSHTQQSYAWLYDGPSPDDNKFKYRQSQSFRHFRSVRASLIKNLKNNSPDQLDFRFIHSFMFDVMTGRIGDEKLGLNNYDRLVDLIREAGVKYVVLLTANTGPDFRPKFQKDSPKPPYLPEHFNVKEAKERIARMFAPIEEDYTEELSDNEPPENSSKELGDDDMSYDF